MAKLVVTLVGDDRPGLVAALTDALAAADGNWLESELVSLAGRFAGVALVEAPDADALHTALGHLVEDGRLTVTLSPAEEGPAAGGGVPLHVFVLGNDRPGILREVSTELASRGVSIDRLETVTRHAPMANALLFELDADVRIPEGVSLAEVRAGLEGLSSELVVDFDSDPEVPVDDAWVAEP